MQALGALTVDNIVAGREVDISVSTQSS
ncbi:hypothetical protein CBM2592_A190024 [Cupriavidus taiwanensis]|nr:hypothetical protein CBM2592_A190024 [Cupriavidus taiwanensis]SOY83048.1 hypothetical protein CBM2591_A230026 [Cupriavidus taiwanensis]SOZ56237.1 hypothetical protein CBM2617_A200032 [Cupriavidus taiwanensis]SOZ78817.1 hypothetical protein CBM2618_A180032 [Cupriavidus taiwanensis]SOZ79094.1 hypothetical protein CBM2622_A170031 [Cupriavidus taiwanensis]